MRIKGLKLRGRSGILAAAAVAALSALAFAFLSVGSAANGATVRTQGNEQFVPNAKISSNLKFTPGHIVVSSGETLTLVHGDQTQEPHTLTIVDKADLPASIEDVFNCGAPGTVCDEAFTALGGPPAAGSFVDAGGGAGLDAPFDTLYVEPGSDASATVTAPSGTTLYFLCLIHPWMQGQITVK